MVMYPASVQAAVAPELAADMLEVDWVFRHVWLMVVYVKHPYLGHLVEELLAPDQLASGRRTGQPPQAVIVLPDRRRGMRQTTLIEHGFVKRPRY